MTASERRVPGEVQLIARDFTNLVRVFGPDAVLVWLRRYAPQGGWRHRGGGSTRGAFEVPVAAMLRVLEGAAAELGFDGPSPTTRPSSGRAV